MTVGLENQPFACGTLMQTANDARVRQMHQNAPKANSAPIAAVPTREPICPVPHLSARFLAQECSD